ncbi:MAG: vanadium-dependent haloperoxidase [Bacteroidia bacterium]|nr:vanadium-dependent haloperoxidase [Bacteroidia bacterium]
MKMCYGLLLLIFLFVGCKNQVNDEPVGKNNLVYKWGKVSMDATADDTEKFSPRPTVTSRFLGLIWTAVFDAWSRYDSIATPVYLKNVVRRPEDERTLKNKEAAISYAAYRTMMVYYAFDSSMLTQKMKEFGFNPDDNSLDPATSVGIGNLAAKTIIDARINDGSNQTGMMEGSKGTPYSDYTGYKPVNPPDTMNDIKHWQPKYFSDGKGGKFAPGCLTAQWQIVKTLMLDSANQFRPGPPPAIGSEELAKEVKEVVDLQANLTGEQKALVEFMRDGPRSVQQAGHWFIFAQDVSERDNHTLEDDVKMYFAVESAAMDAFIACWDAKMYYDFARPYALVHYYFKDKNIKGWGGPEKGWIEMKGQDWRPYSPDVFLCPAFPSYVSGHSTISGACSEILRLYTGDDHFGVEVKRTPGELTEPNNLGDPVILKFPTFTETANMAGISRVMGGYHIPAENREGLRLGRNVGNAVFKKYLTYVNGTN